MIDPICPYCNDYLQLQDDMYSHPVKVKKDHFYSLLMDNNNLPEEEFLANGKYELIFILAKNIYSFDIMGSDGNYSSSIEGLINNQKIVDVFNNIIQRVEKLKAFM